MTLNLLFVGRTQRITQYTATRYAVGPGFERPSRIVVALRLRKSAACVTPYLVGHRSKKTIINCFFFANRFRCTKDYTVFALY